MGTGSHDEANTRTLNNRSSAKSDVFGLQIVVTCLLDTERDRLRFTSENGLIDAQAMDGDETQISGNFFTKTENNQITRNNLQSGHLSSLPITNDSSSSGHHAIDAFHDSITAVVRINRSSNVEKSDDNQGNSQGKSSRIKSTSILR